MCSLAAPAAAITSHNFPRIYQNPVLHARDNSCCSKTAAANNSLLSTNWPWNVRNITVMRKPTRTQRKTAGPRTAATAYPIKHLSPHYARAAKELAACLRTRAWNLFKCKRAVAAAAGASYVWNVRLECVCVCVAASAAHDKVAGNFYNCYGCWVVFWGTLNTRIKTKLLDWSRFVVIVFPNIYDNLFL